MNARVVWLIALLPAVGGAAPADDAGVTATASCERKAARGRVICDVELEVPSGRIAWADVVVVEAPAFAPPLRSRVGLGEARTRTERRVRLPVALVATGQGRGTLGVRARAVVCTAAPAGERCVPSARDVSTELVVGTEVDRR